MRGSVIKYNAAEIAYIEARHTLPRRVLHAEFVKRFKRNDVDLDAIKRLCCRNGWTTRTRWNAEDDAMLRTQYADISTAKLAVLLDRDTNSVYHRAHKLGLHKSAEYLASADACRLRRGDNVGAAHQFPKGHVPANKGVKRPPGWSAGNMKETQFKKGQPPWNWMPIGSTRLVDGYEYTKISDVRCVPYTVNWKPTHVLGWEAVNGSVPKKHALKCLDGNRLNTHVSNWQLVPLSMLPRLSGRTDHGRLGYDAAPAELKPILMAVAKLQNAASVHRRRKSKNSTPAGV